MSSEQVIARYKAELEAAGFGDVLMLTAPLEVLYGPDQLVAMLDQLLSAYARARGAQVTLPQEALTA